MGTDVLCHAPGCQKEAALRCQRCDRAFCGQHIVGVRRPPDVAARGRQQRRHFLGTPERATIWLCRPCATASATDRAGRGARS
jgi:hypothetical protein